MQYATCNSSSTCHKYTDEKYVNFIQILLKLSAPYATPEILLQNLSQMNLFKSSAQMADFSIQNTKKKKKKKYY